jgi:hypothetical protein
LDKRIRDVDYGNVPSFLGIDDACEENGLGGNGRRTGVLLRYVVPLFVAAGNGSAFYGTVAFLFEKHVGFEDRLALGGREWRKFAICMHGYDTEASADIMLVHRLKGLENLRHRSAAQMLDRGIAYLATQSQEERDLVDKKYVKC